MKKSYLVCLILITAAFQLNAQFAENKKNYQQFDGLFNFYHDPVKDKIYLEVSELEKEFLYVYSLSSGIGSNDLNLDRGQLGNEQVVFFRKAGNKLLLIQPNLKFRALTDNVLEKQSVEQAFAKSVLYGAEIVAENNGTYVIDATDFLMRDAHGVSLRLKNAKQGNYSLDKSKSAMNLSRTKAFPKNVEFDALLTFKGEAKGEYIRSVTPNPGLVTVTQHHSFIELPDDNYEKRDFDPRSGSYPFSYYDYATPVEEPIVKRYVRRHRLNKKDPNAAMSEAVEPIVYYLDNGTPEPVRSALLEGGKWWNQAFEAAGYKDAFQVEILPSDADPMDVRYNVIQWVHRSTRGWSYGSSVTDPRTGEIIKGHVSLGSLRIRQDFLIAQSLMNKPFAERDDNHEEILGLALARIRQLSAHEIGHTLGFAHNFAASTNGRASVMDYPHPRISLNNGQISFDGAYDVGIGEWDKVTVAYSYSDFSDGIDERAALNEILENAYENGLHYISDADARPWGGAHATGHLWDNGSDPSAELQRVLDIREHAIANFSIDNIRTNEPNSVLEDVFVPLYLFHRYQVEAAVKLIGGLEYNYSVKGSNFPEMKVVGPDNQREALNQLLSTIDASEIAIPADKLGLFPPRAIGYSRSRESFKGHTGTAFDPVSAAVTASDLSLGLMFHPERAARLIQQKSLDDKQLGLHQYIDEILQNTVFKTHKDSYEQVVQNAINFRVLEHLIGLAANKNSTAPVRAQCHSNLLELKTKLLKESTGTEASEMVRMIDSYFKNPTKFKLNAAPKIPDGSPIGMDCAN